MLLAALSILWGIPYLFIKFAVAELSPPVIVAGRTAIAALVLLPLAIGSGALRQLRGRLGVISVLALVHVVGPFLLITYGEVYIASGLTALLLATQPLIIAALALRFDPSERVGGRRLLGLGIGLVGVAAVVGFDIGADNRNGLLGAGMVLLAGVGYACATFLVRHKLSGVAPLGVAAGTMSITTVLLAPVALLTAPVAMPTAKAAISVVVLGLFSTALALVLFYRMIAMAGAGSAALVSYTSPAVAVLLGVMVLSEPLTPVTLLGFGLILTGSWLSTRRAAPLVSPDESAASGNAAPRRDLGPEPVPGHRQPGLAAGGDGVQAVPELQDGPQLAAGLHLHRAGTVAGAER
ncbi:membrane protein [Rhizocola hellebori]|uniref:Membrane protein n=1 Tax=Rhizocola hellebori TaxID=1392758 RepID=A0A8J3Q4C3_9ACTN|nr:membrane protein [Rhizocola hellebori]